MKLNLFGKRSTKKRVVSSALQTPVGSPLSPLITEPREELSMGKKSRRIFVNMEPKDHKGRAINQSFCSNRIQTTKYTFYTFIFKNLYEQFRSVANSYFLFLALLQLVEEFKLIDFSLTIAPIVIIVVVTGLKDAIEDYRRYKTDASVNSSQTYVLRNSIISSEETEQEAEKEFLPAKALNFLVYFFTEYFLYSTKIIKRPLEEGNPLKAKKAPFLTAHDYIHHEKPKRNSIVIRASTMQPPVNDAYWKLKQWASIKVGDFVLVRSDDPIPADIAIISTSEPDCVCYIETKNLDGETNLKIRRGITELAHLRTPTDCLEAKCFLDVEAPNELMYSFSAALRLNPTTYDLPRSTVTAPRHSIDRKYPQSAQKDKGVIVVPISINGVLLRGCSLRNTDWVIGVIVYTGDDTKLMRNAGITPSKRSKIDRLLNPQILLNFVILFALCFICGILGAIYQGAFNSAAVPFALLDDIVGSKGAPAYIALITFFTCMIIFQNIIPIALYISIDVAKTFQSFLIYLDEEMYDSDSEKYVQPRTWNLCDDLGQIEYIFSDKTGTLTCNIMEFRRCSINGIMYGNSYPPEMTDVKEYRTDPTIPKSKRELDEVKMREYMKIGFNTKYVSSEPFSFIDPELHKHLNKGGDQAVAIKQFFALLSVCHTVLVETYEDDPNSVIYKAQSPDEKALVEVSRDIGFAFLKRTNNAVMVNMLGEDQTFFILHVMEFNSERKRMSIILKPPAAMNLAEGDVLLFCKGADSVIYDRLSANVDADLKSITRNHLELFGNEGLRTLCLAFRIIPRATYEPWAEQFRAAQALLKDREIEIDKISDSIERDLTLMGATAIEDRLQDGVPESISVLSKAGIKIWVLTGDKMETAINIGFSCNLLRKNMKLIVITGSSCEETHRQLKDALTKFWKVNGEPLNDVSHALVIDGVSLTYVFDERSDKKKVKQATLLELACRCTSVVCCRVSPLQKAQVVALVRKGLGAMCLSIGDGANDVSMIQEADVGIGISGKEGLQAVMASDYAIAQFRFLTRLLLVHGRWAYMRISEMILLYFYKNVVWLFVLFWYQFDSGFTADTITDFTYGMFFNTIFSLLPNMVVGALDQDVSDKLSLTYPGLYGKGIRQELYNMQRFWLYIFDGIYQSIISYYTAIFILGEGIVDQRGLVGDTNLVGSMIAINCIITVNIYMGINNFSWTWITHFSVYATIIVFIIYLVSYASQISSPTFGQVHVLLTQPQLYFGVILSITTALLPRVAFKSIQQYFFPNDTDIVQEIMKFKINKSEDGSEAQYLNSTDAAPSSIRKRPESEMLSKTLDINDNSNVSVPGELSNSAQNSDITGKPVAQSSGIRPLSFIKADASFKRRMLSSRDDDLNSSYGSKTRKQSNSISGAVSNMKDVFIQPLTTVGRNVGDYVKKKLRFGNSARSSTIERTSNGIASLVYMGTQKEFTNTGFAFSHEEGMEDVITPSHKSAFVDVPFFYNGNLEEIPELPEDNSLVSRTQDTEQSVEKKSRVAFVGTENSEAAIIKFSEQVVSPHVFAPPSPEEVKSLNNLMASIMSSSNDELQLSSRLDQVTVTLKEIPEKNEENTNTSEHSIEVEALGHLQSRSKDGPPVSTTLSTSTDRINLPVFTGDFDTNSAVISELSQQDATENGQVKKIIEDDEVGDKQSGN